MRMQAFSVYDGAAKAYLEPFFADTVEVAIRMFRAVVSKPDHQFARFPEDYTLFHLGEFDQELGLLNPLKTPHSLGLAVQFVVAPGALKVVSNG